jgi:hypothetical protein
MNNPPAFPIVIDLGDGVKYQTGMTLRDYFAAKAMQGYCSDPDYKKDCGQEDTAISAYKMADAMLKAREA